MCPLPEDSPAPLASTARSSEPNEFSPEERTLLLKLAHNAVLAAGWSGAKSRWLRPPRTWLKPRGAFTTLYYRGGSTRLRRLCVSGEFALSHCGRKRAGRSIRRHPFSSGDPAGSSRPGSLSQHPFRPRAHNSRKDRGWTSRSADQPGCQPGSAAAASAGRARMGSRNLPRTNLQKSRLACECMADRRQPESFHRGSVRRPPVSGRVVAGDAARVLHSKNQGGRSLPEMLSLNQARFIVRRVPRDRPRGHLPARTPACRWRSSE